MAAGAMKSTIFPAAMAVARINGRFYDIVPGTLYVTGPHVEHAQTPHLEDPMCEYCIYLKTEKSAAPSPSAGPQPDGRERALSLFEGTTFWFGQDTQNVAFLMEELFPNWKTAIPVFSCRWSCCCSSFWSGWCAIMKKKKPGGLPASLRRLIKPP